MRPSKMSLPALVSIAAITFSTAPALADGFDWGADCSSGADSFNQYIAHQDIVTVGTIPANKRNVRIELTSSADVDVQLIDVQSGTQIIAWPDGLLSGPSAQSVSHAGVTYRYSGYNGDGVNLGNEFIEIVGDTNRPLIMRAFGYAAGNALVNYAWSASPNCEDGGSGQFQQQVAANAILEVGVIPAGKANVFVQLESQNGRDIDVQLYHGSNRIIVWDSNGNHGLFHGPTQETKTYAGMSITYSGYNGRSGNQGLEDIQISGTTTLPLTVKVFGYQSGQASVNYSWGGTTTPTVSTRPIPPPTFVGDPSRLVAIGDLHGDFQALRRVLRLVGAINTSDSWIGGSMAIVQVGDQLDRGNGERAIIDMLERLADEAHAQGGGVYVLNGNHETMNVDFDFRYVTPGGWSEFSNIQPSGNSEAWSYPSYQRGRVAAFEPGGPYAEILAGHNTTIVVGDTLFVHGGILPSHVNDGLENLNLQVQRWMHGYRAKPSFLGGDDSPVWSRHYSQDPSSSDCAMLESVLDAVGVSRMVVAHTVQQQGINSACNGQVWRVDVGMSAHYGGAAAGLEIVGEMVSILD